MVLTLICVTVRTLLFILMGGSDNTDSVRIFSYDSPSSNGTVIPNCSMIDPNNELIIMVHGFGSIYTDFQNICQLTKQKYPNRTVLNLDWKQQAEGPNYIKAAKNVDMIGNYLGQCLLDANINPDKLWIVGHSLGAHAAGIAAKKMFAETGMKVKEVRGEDPAGPFFGYFVLLPAYLRLDAADAQIVRCVHTNRYVFGNKFDLGSINVYVNSAWLQPGCEDEVRWAYCSHLTTYPLYAKAIVDSTYVAHKISGFSMLNEPEGIDLKDSLIMGEDTPPNKRGIYYLKTGLLST